MHRAVGRTHWVSLASSSFGITSTDLHWPSAHFASIIPLGIMMCTTDFVLEWHVEPSRSVHPVCTSLPYVLYPPRAAFISFLSFLAISLRASCVRERKTSCPVQTQRAALRACVIDRARGGRFRRVSSCWRWLGMGGGRGSEGEDGRAGRATLTSSLIGEVHIFSSSHPIFAYQNEQQRRRQRVWCPAHSRIVEDDVFLLVSVLWNVARRGERNRCCTR